MSVFNQFTKTQPSSLSTQLNSCAPGAAVFYQLNASEKAHASFLERLSQSKASLVLVNGKSSCTDKRVHCLDKEQFELILNTALNEYYPVPDKTYLAVTGTNGKTSTVYLLAQIFAQNSKRTLTIGTLGTKLNGKTIRDDGLTTPGVCELRAILDEQKENFDVMIMETSSHALVQGRLSSVRFDVAGWTNLTQDHLDYHKSMEEYFRAKLQLLNYLRPQAKLFVAKEELVKKIGKAAHYAKPYSEANVIASLQTPFARENLGLALAMAKELGVNVLRLNELTPPPGRFQILEHDSVKVIVDYAHTPDALVNACDGIKKAFPTSKLTVVFGCGGDRDRMKRPLMAQAVLANSDKCIVTSDNPRTEDPQQIIEDIVTGLSPRPVTITDRKLAIETALKEARAHEVILIAGKGHETYQEINGVRYDFDDAKVVQSFWGIK